MVDKLHELTQTNASLREKINLWLVNETNTSYLESFQKVSEQLQGIIDTMKDKVGDQEDKLADIDMDHVEVSVIEEENQFINELRVINQTAKGW